MNRLPFKNSFDYIRSATFFDALSPSSKNAILDLILEDDFMGATDPGTLGFLYALIAGNRYSTLLQLGTWMGFSTIVLGDALRRSVAIHHRDIVFDSVERDPRIHDRARMFIKRAGLGDMVRCVDGSSTDTQVLKNLHAEYDFIYVDASHAAGETKREIEIYYPMLKKGGAIVFHDSSLYAARWDPTNSGGVRKAIDDWLASPGRPDQHLFFEQPFWASECGLFIARRAGS